MILEDHIYKKKTMWILEKTWNRIINDRRSSQQEEILDDKIKIKIIKWKYPYRSYLKTTLSIRTTSNWTKIFKGKDNEDGFFLKEELNFTIYKCYLLTLSIDKIYAIINVLCLTDNSHWKFFLCCFLSLPFNTL